MKALTMQKYFISSTSLCRGYVFKCAYIFVRNSSNELVKINTDIASRAKGKVWNVRLCTVL